jgi:hypothetical protein
MSMQLNGLPVTGKSLMGDVYGGLTAAVVALPLALAFGVASGVGRWSQCVVATLYLKRQRWSVQMKRRRRIYFTAGQKSEIWDRWQRGESMS